MEDRDKPTVPAGTTIKMHINTDAMAQAIELVRSQLLDATKQVPMPNPPMASIAQAGANLSDHSIQGLAAQLGGLHCGLPDNAPPEFLAAIRAAAERQEYLARESLKYHQPYHGSETTKGTPPEMPTWVEYARDWKMLDYAGLSAQEIVDRTLREYEGPTPYALKERLPLPYEIKYFVGDASNLDIDTPDDDDDAGDSEDDTYDDEDDEDEPPHLQPDPVSSAMTVMIQQQTLEWFAMQIHTAFIGLVHKADAEHEIGDTDIWADLTQEQRSVYFDVAYTLVHTIVDGKLYRRP